MTPNGQITVVFIGVLLYAVGLFTAIAQVF